VVIGKKNVGYFIQIFTLETKIRVWRVNIEEYEEIPSSSVQGEESVQGYIIVKEVGDTSKIENKLMLRVTTI
jgi:hypothetical protein